MILSGLLPIANHLWQSTLFAVIAGLLTLLLRNNRAHIRYCLWLTASAKFLVPFSLLVFAGSQLGRHPAIAPAGIPLLLEQVNEPFGAEVSLKSTPTAHATQSASLLVPLLVALWASGSGVLVFAWWRRWRHIQVALRAASPVPLAIGVPVRSSASFLEPGVFGVFHPVLLLPEGIADHLEPAELHAILAHELCHVQRRDNLATVMHMVVEAVFWFHPLVWWLGARLVEERERACDEEVLATGSKPEAYAEGILKICEFYLQSPLKCVAGVTGANLKQRIEAIMNNRLLLKLNFAKRAGLAVAGVAALAVPIIVGVAGATAARAQTDAAPRPEFEVASIRPSKPGTLSQFGAGNGGGGGANVTLKTLIAFAYRLQQFQILGGPGWVNSDRFDIEAKAADPKTPPDQVKLMLQSLFADRFKLAVHRETKQSNVYALVVAKGGPKIKLSADQTSSDVNGPSPPGAGPNHGAIRMGASSMIGNATPLSRFANLLSQRLDRPVIDKTNLTGRFDLRLQWTPDIGENPLSPTGYPVVPIEPVDPSAPSIFVAIQEQLGLKLEAGKGSVEFLVIDHVEKPSEN